LLKQGTSPSVRPRSIIPYLYSTTICALVEDVETTSAVKTRSTPSASVQDTSPPFPHLCPAFRRGFPNHCANRGKPNTCFGPFHRLFQISSKPQPRFRKKDMASKPLLSSISEAFPLFHSELRLLRGSISLTHPQPVKPVALSPRSEPPSGPASTHHFALSPESRKPTSFPPRPQTGKMTRIKGKKREPLPPGS